MQFKLFAKNLMTQMGLLDFSIFLLEDQFKSFKWSKLLHNLQHRWQGAPDGLAIPSAYLMWLVVGASEIHGFLNSGIAHRDVILGMLDENNLAFEQFDTVLDFGCGCGRIMRYWKDIQHVQLYGSDYNLTPIHWCRKHLIFAQFEVNQLLPPLNFESEKFDFIYARSIFTHLTREGQLVWIDELRRVLKPSGYLLFTVSGNQFLKQFTDIELEHYQAGKIVVRDSKWEGKNYCAAFHPPQCISPQLLGDNFQVTSFWPGSVTKPYCMQDTYLVKKQ